MLDCITAAKRVDVARSCRPKGDQRWGGDLAELRFNVMGFHGIRLLDKGFQGLRGAAADKSCE